MKKSLLCALLCAFAALAPAVFNCAHAAEAPDGVFAGGGKAIRMSAPPVPQAVALLRASESASFREAGVKAEFTPWRSPELLRVFVANGAVDAVIAPLPTAAVLSRKGIPCRVLAVYSAPLWVVSTEARAAELSGNSPSESFTALHGAEVLLPFGPGEMPELAMKALAAQLGVELKMRHSGSALEAANLLRRGLAACAMLPEPAATLVTAQESPAGRIGKRFALKDVWLRAFSGQNSMPTAALVMVGPLAEDPEACSFMHRAFIEGLAWAERNPAEALQLAVAKYPELGKMLNALPESGKEVFLTPGLLEGPQGAQAARFVLERIFAVSPAALGGQLPEADFWSFLDAAK